VHVDFTIMIELFVKVVIHINVKSIGVLIPIVWILLIVSDPMRCGKMLD
jgi:hypothetical protein